MRQALLILLTILAIPLFCEPRGMTTAPLDDNGATIRTEIRLFPAQTPRPATGQRDDWYPVSTDQIRTILPAKAQFGLKYDHATGSTSLYSSLGELSPAAKTAISRSPLWMQAELCNVLLQLDPEKQAVFAGLINSTPDPYIDEVAFAIANSSTLYLNSDFALPELFTENAAYIYSIAAELPYVEIIDHGSSVTDPNYYSTTRYRSLNADGETVYTEVPRDIYYWYIVHPRLSDEIAAYIDPEIVESNSTHTNNITAPPQGKFWRSYLYTVTEAEYPVLADTLRECQTLFNRNGTGGDAIRTIQWWINHTMNFTSNNERPHQPVRIYKKHMGRCGEYQDYTNATARLALIPCTSITSVSTDHVWNEFWDQSWVQWEPVNGYINSPLVYENGWGKVFGSVFETRSDGYFTPVTDRYSEGHALIRIRVVDQDGLPVDGARVILAIFETTPRTDNVGFTDNEGYVDFIVGDNRDFRARAETSWGIYPEIAGTYTALTPNSVAGETYNYQFQIAQSLPRVSFSTITAPIDPVQDHRFEIAYQCPEYYISGRATWDDITTLGGNSIFYRSVQDPGDAAVFSVNDDDLLFLQYDLMASVFDDPAPASAGSYSFSIPTTANWYSLLDNSHRSGNAVKVVASLVSSEYGTGVADDVMVCPARLMSISPNPASGQMKISLRGNAGEIARVRVYNQRGQMVREIHSTGMTSSEMELVWDGKNALGEPCVSGIYFVQCRIGSRIQTEKAILIR